MNYELKMPDLAATGSAMTLLHWLVKAGQTVQRGEKLFEVETDKATVEVESPAGGVLREARFKPGDTVCAGDILAIIETTDVPVSQAPAAQANAPATPATAPIAPLSGKDGGMFARNREAAARRQKHL